MSYRTSVQVRPDGSVAAVFTDHESRPAPPGSAPVPAEIAQAVRKAPRRFRSTSGNLRPRVELRMVPSKRRPRPGETFTVEFVGTTPSRLLKVRVGDQTAEVDPKKPFEVLWEDPANITISLDDPEFYCDPVIVLVTGDPE